MEDKNDLYLSIYFVPFIINISISMFLSGEVKIKGAIIKGPVLYIFCFLMVIWCFYLIYDYKKKFLTRKPIKKIIMKLLSSPFTLLFIIAIVYHFLLLLGLIKLKGIYIITIFFIIYFLLIYLQYKFLKEINN